MTQAENTRRTVVVLATGGTIAGTGEAGRSVGYVPGQIPAGELISNVPAISRLADVTVEQICNVNSDDITDEVWLTLARRVNELADREDVAGFVITHGTDTMEETAFFLHLTVKTDKPVVLTGSMRPSTATSADGPMNLYQAVNVAVCPESRGKGVLLVFSDQIYSARTAVKSSTYSVTAMTGGSAGPIGIIRDDSIYYFEQPSKPHTVDAEFDLKNVTSLPRVNVLYFCVDADPALLRAAAEVSDGLVIAGAGAGEYSLRFKSVIDSLSIPVVISSRITNCIIAQNMVLSPNAVGAGNLQPQKAAILLRLALTQTKERNEIVRIFDKY